jgi:hypothetical protein
MTPTPALREAILDVRAEIGRADVKASILLPVALGALTLTVDTDQARPVAYAAVVLLLGSVVLAAVAVMPRLNGGHGFVRWSDTDPEAVLATFSPDRAGGQGAADAQELIWLSRAAHRKFVLIRWSIAALLAGVAVAELARLIGGAA